MTVAGRPGQGGARLKHTHTFASPVALCSAPNLPLPPHSRPRQLPPTFLQLLLGQLASLQVQACMSSAMVRCSCSCRSRRSSAVSRTRVSSTRLLCFCGCTGQEGGIMEEGEECETRNGKRDIHALSMRMLCFCM